MPYKYLGVQLIQPTQAKPTEHGVPEEKPKQLHTKQIHSLQRTCMTITGVLYGCMIPYAKRSTEKLEKAITRVAKFITHIYTHTCVITTHIEK